MKLYAFYLFFVSRIHFFDWKRESRAYFLHIYSLVTFSEDVSMMSEKYEVSLVVEGNYSSASEFWLLWEKWG